MGRIRQMIMVNGRECWTLFDTGARNTYVVHSVIIVVNIGTILNQKYVMLKWR